MKRKRKNFELCEPRIGAVSADSSRDSRNKLTSKGFKPGAKSKKSITDIKSRLAGSRFRFLNEQLYSSTSAESWAVFRRDPNLFKVYHEGYRNQVAQWPYNPVEEVVSWLEAHGECRTIGDFGCGDALVARSLPDRTVHSFDLVATNEFVTACNMLKVPLADGVLDAAVFCLSLMGRDWPMFVLEATRCLKTGGVLKVVEVASRLSDVPAFLKFICSYGYRVRHYSAQAGDFFVSFEFELGARAQPAGAALERGSRLLSACLYKHR